MNPEQNNPQQIPPEAPNLEQPIPADQPYAPRPAPLAQPLPGATPSVDTTPNARPVEQPPVPSPQTPAAPIPTEQVQPASAPSPVAGPSKGLAIASLVVGIIGFLTGFIGIGILLGIAAVILGIISLVKHKGGKVLAIIGIILGALTVVFGSIAFLIFMSLASLQENQRETNAMNQQLQQESLEGRQQTESDLFE